MEAEHPAREEIRHLSRLHAIKEALQREADRRLNNNFLFPSEQTDVTVAAYIYAEGALVHAWIVLKFDPF